MPEEKRTKVLLISPVSGTAGGIMRWTNHVAQRYAHIPDNERLVELDFFDFGRKVEGYLTKSTIKKIYYAATEYTRLIYGACRTIRRIRPDVVHITSPGSFLSLKDYILVRYAKKNHCKTIIHYRFGRIPELFKIRNLEFHLLRKVINVADKIIVIDRNSYDTLKITGYKNLHLLPNPLSEETFRLAAKYSTEERLPNTILFAGHVLPTKGTRELVEACREIKNIRLTVLGAVSEAYKTELYNLAGPESKKWLDIKGEADYETTIREMCRNSIFALPTYTEGFPNVILETMACGIPIVTCPVGAIPEMLDIGDGSECGIMVPVRDVIGLREGIGKMLNDKEYASFCSRKAKSKVLENYTMEKVWTMLENIWQSKD